ncbi:MAG TPA: ABC transporter permease [Gaiellaceae bacterium]|nr:ABC transporter permease [Gaiellaceae bacterium]
MARRRIDVIGRRVGRAAASAAFFDPGTRVPHGSIEWDRPQARPDAPSIVTTVTAVDLDVPRAAPRDAWRLTLGRFFADRTAVAALVAFAFVLFASFAGGPIVSTIVGHNGFQQYPYATNANLDPAGVWSRVPTTVQVRLDEYGNVLPPPKSSRTLMILGADGPLGRDELIRVLDGGKSSIEVGVFAVLISALIAVPLGCLAGFYGGKIDAIVSRLTEWVMAFPLIFFLVFATMHLTATLRPIGWGHVIPSGVPMVALLIGVFTSFYPLRLVRAQLLTLRNAEFVDSSRMVGASGLRIIRKDLLPHLVPTLLVWGAVAVATDMLLEVGLSVIGVGVQASTATWGTLLAQTTGTIYSAGPGSGAGAHHTTWHTIWPTVAILVSVVSLNQVSEGIRRAIEPWRRA